MASNKYAFGAAPLQDHIVPGMYLTDSWRNWFVDLQKQFLIRWEDLTFPSQGIVAVGGEGVQPGRDTNTGLLTFAGNQDNVIVGFAEMRHRWLPGSLIRPHLHLQFPSIADANTRWSFEYDIANVNADFSGGYTALPTITVANPRDALLHVFASFGNLTMTSREESCGILWKVTRLGLSDVIDDDPNAVTLLSFDIAYQVQKPGTVPELT